MIALEQLKRIQKSCENDFFSKPGVHGVGIGYKHTANKATPHLAILVYVDKKISRDRISQADLIPLHVSGVPTDIIEQARFVNAIGTINPSSPSPAPIGRALQNTGTYRPLVGGCAISANTKPGTFGTLGGFGITNPDPPFFPWVVGISCEHVVGPFVPNIPPNSNMTYVLQPAGGSVVAALMASINDEFVDAGAFGLQNGDPGSGYNNTSLGLGAVGGTYSLTLSDIGKTVSKSGAQSNVTSGNIQAINVTELRNNIMTFDNIVISGQFADHGDSGSFVVLQVPGGDYSVVGLLWAKSPNTPQGDPQTGIATNIANVLNSLNVSIPPPMNPQKRES